MTRQAAVLNRLAKKATRSLEDTTGSSESIDVRYAQSESSQGEQVESEGEDK